MGTEALADSEERALLTEAPYTPRTFFRGRYSFVAIATVTAGALLLLSRVSPSLLVMKANEVTFLEQLTENTCNNFAMVTVNGQPKLNNLGNKGDGEAGSPKEGEEEGIIFDVNYKEPGAESVQRDFHIHVVGDPDSYKDLQTKGYKNGLEEKGKKLMDITQPAGYKVDLKMYFTEPDKTDPIEMKEVYLSFFDIDGGPDHGEFVTAKGMSQYLLQKTSAIVKEEKDDGSINFQSPKGDNAPNVQDPAKMEPKQLNHALTLHFEKSKEWTFTLGSIGEKKG